MAGSIVCYSESRIGQLQSLSIQSPSKNNTSPFPQTRGSLYGGTLLWGGFQVQRKKIKKEITELLRSKLEQRVHVRILPFAHKQTAAERNKSQYKRRWCLFTELSSTFSNSYSGNECSTWKQQSLSSRDGRALFPMKADDWESHKSYRRGERGRWHG